MSARATYCGDCAAGGILRALMGRAHQGGVTVYNLEVDAAHTYFVRAEDSDAAPVWVHNAARGYDQFADFGAKPGSKLALDVPSSRKGRSYISYTFRDIDGNITYVGKTTGHGTPQQELNRRLSRGHNHMN